MFQLGYNKLINIIRAIGFKGVIYILQNKNSIKQHSI